MQLRQSIIISAVKNTLVAISVSQMPSGRRVIKVRKEKQTKTEVARVF